MTGRSASPTAAPLARAALALAGAVAVTAIAGCGPDADHFRIQFNLERGDGATCPSDSCENIPLACDAMVLLRILDVADGQPLYSQCERIDGGGNLCTLGQLDVSGIDPLPNTMVEIQMAAWPADEVGGECPDVSFTRDGAPLQIDSQQPTPAIAGRAYFEVGSGEVAPVTLACVDVPALDADACKVPPTVMVTAIVDDFDIGVSVPPSLAQFLDVRVGEPVQGAGTWVLDTAATTKLDSTQVAPVPIWQQPADAMIMFDHFACIQVEHTTELERSATVTCQPVTADVEQVSATGWLVDRSTLDQVRQALGLASLPPLGLVLGRVLDHLGQPAEGVVVSATPAAGTNIYYLSDDLTTTDGITATQSSGLFVSVDAPFPTTWTAEATDGRVQNEVGTGGQLEGKVTVVILRLAEPAKAP
ncbi:MAG: hypothetical protein H6709_07555 [Kofleriaceae bacterium]|nr:hypothetical protein [Myxococcales bacterium]MCB9560015.1 hypothetical protein [Kofleriaceae bacterium]MCB9571934.1 hypothetical protein [Kofleriaceae bacterium]